MSAACASSRSRTPQGGVYAAGLTPMKPDLRVDHEALAGHCRWLLDEGCHGVVALGTTGEANSLSMEERIEVIERLLHSGLPGERIIAGTGCCALPDTIALTRRAVSGGAGGVLVLPPFYYKRVSDEGLFAVFDRLIQAVGDPGLKIYLYHIPPLTGVPFTHALIERLIARYPDNVAGIKDSSGDFENMKAMAEAFPGFQVFAGTERFLLDLLEAGGAGCISATVNATARLAAKVYAAWKTAEARTLQGRLTAAREAFEGYPFVPALKRYMAERTGRRAWLRLRPPLWPISDAEAAALQEKLGGLGY